MVAEAKFVKLSATSLYSKYGFYDGDLLYKYFNNLIDGRGNPCFKGAKECYNLFLQIKNEDRTLIHQYLLPFLVKKYLVPQLNTKLETIIIKTRHNPIRAKNWEMHRPEV